MLHRLQYEQNRAFARGGPGRRARSRVRAPSSVEGPRVPSGPCAAACSAGSARRRTPRTLRRAAAPRLLSGQWSALLPARPGPRGGGLHARSVGPPDRGPPPRGRGTARSPLAGGHPAWLVRPLPSAASSTSGARRGFRAFVPSRCGGPRAAAAYRYPTVQPIVRTGHCTYTELKACRNASLRQTTRNGEPACDGAVWRVRSLESRVS